MADFMKLIQNENMKIYRRVRTWIMLGLIVFIPILISILFYFAVGDRKPSNWNVMYMEAAIISVLITIFTVVKAADSVAGEFTWGTIKLLLIRPWSRSSILLSKFLSLLLFALLFTIVAFVVTWLVNTLLFGYSSTPDDLIDYSVNSLAVTDSPWAYMLLLFLCHYIGLIFVVTFGFMMSAAFRSGGLAIGLSIFLLLSGNLITGMIVAFTDKPWVKYLPFLHTDLTSYLNGGTGPIPDHPMTLAFSLTVLAGYFILFNLVSWLVFCKRDVAA
ncbi:ABC transporter permease [Cohnella sp.]|uniref:ABC transporter permease n=1 Tax=Cohnella sp. TaxID=1883426 RepID=UPI0035630072